MIGASAVGADWQALRETTGLGLRIAATAAGAGAGGYALALVSRDTVFRRRDVT
ncbi:MAG TPA: hypothetical protein VHE80_10425 [Acidimicrobiales bacterium]|nr:hypothetical protein [Acidimicrobiales bacterium]